MERYPSLRERKDTSPAGLSSLLMLCDLDLAIKRLSPWEYSCVLLHGLLGYTVRVSAEVLDVAPSTFQDDYDAALRNLTDCLNGQS